MQNSSLKSLFKFEPSPSLAILQILDKFFIVFVHGKNVKYYETSIYHFNDI
jgi:hypothetical protein